MIELTESPLINGVITANLTPFKDERGYFLESFRKEWFPQRSWAKFQCNRSESSADVLRGLHYHHHQVDYWYVTRGMIRVGLFDMRPWSDTYRQTQTIDMGSENEIGLFIPIGVAHGFITLSAATLTYIVDNYYDKGQDENGVAWDDPDVGVDWGVVPRTVSGRDAENPRWRDIPAENLPQPPTAV